MRKPGFALRLQDRQGEEITRRFYLRAADGLHRLAQLQSEAGQGLAFETHPCFTLLRTLGHRAGIARQATLPPGGDRLRAHVFKIGQHGVVVKQDPAEAGVSGQIFVDVGDLLANPGIPGRQTDVRLAGK